MRRRDGEADWQRHRRTQIRKRRNIGNSFHLPHRLVQVRERECSSANFDYFLGLLHHPLSWAREFFSTRLTVSGKSYYPTSSEKEACSKRLGMEIFAT